MTEKVSQYANTRSTLLTFMATAAATANPHQGIQENITLIARFHGKIDAILVGIWTHRVCSGRFVDLVQNVFSSGQPSIGLDDEICWRIVGSLKNKARKELGGAFLCHNLIILPARLNSH